MIYLRQSTASQEVVLGIFVDSTDGNTTEESLTIANTDIKLWVTGATTLANKNSGGATHISGGIYYAVLDATDTATLGPLVIFVKVAGALAVRVPCVVLDEAVYDVMFGTVAPATVSNITAGVITTATNVTTVNGLAAGVITAAAIADNAIDAGAIAADAITSAKIADNAITANKIAADAITAAKIADGAIDAATFAAGAITAAAIAADAIGASELAADAVTEIAAAIVIPSAAAIADAVWDEATTGHTTSGTFGEQLKTDVDAILEDTGTTLQAEVDGIQADTEDIQTRLPVALVSGRIDASVGAMATDTLTAAALAADAVTEISGGGGLDAAAVRAAVGLASANLDTQLGAIDDFLDLEIAAIKAKTDNLPTDPADASDIAAAFATVNTNLNTVAGYIDTEVAAIKTVTDAIGATGAGLTDIPFNAAWGADIEAAVEAVLDSILPDSVPAVGTRATARQALYMLVQIATEVQVVGTAMTINKVDHSTPLMELTMDHATAPTSLERAS